jgi:tetratricopeptide (TPR) repeat protein
VPKVIDFGVAKATEQRLTERTMFTQYGQIVGTFEYMSPEQAEMSQLGVDTRSDIYSLGVMLYELLTGSTPLQRQRLREAGLAEMLKIVKEEEPPKPSTRLSSTQGVAKIAAARRTEPVRLTRLLRGELDWVVMKCLEKDRARRYDTANGLARDIERYLHEEPVEAGPPGAGYRLRKLARKHRAALNIAAAFLALLVLAAAVSIWQAIRATAAERQALAERDRAEQEKERAEHEKDRAEAGFRMFRDTVDRFFTQVGESPKLKALGMEKFRKELLQSAKDLYERFTQAEPDKPTVRHDLGLAHLRLAKIQQALGDYATAQASSEKAIEILGELARKHAGAAQYQRPLAASYFQLGEIYFHAGRWDKAEMNYQQALDMQEKLAEGHPEVAEDRRALAMTQSGLGLLHDRAGRLEKAQASLEQALPIWNQLVANDSNNSEDRHGLASLQRLLGNVYRHKGWSEKAEMFLKGAESSYRALVRDYPEVPQYRESLGTTYHTLGSLYHDNMAQAEKAEAAHQQSLQIFEKLANDHRDVLEFMYRVGYSYFLLALDADLAGRTDAALTRYDRACEILEGVVGRGYGLGRIELFDSRILRAVVLAGRGDHARAIDEASAVARQEGLNVKNIYNLVCVFSQSSAAAEKDSKLSPADRTRLKAQYADRAMDFLQQAVTNGFQNIALLKTDKDLNQLRSREDFQKLVQELERKAKN